MFMANVVRDRVEGIGVADSLPENPKYFTELSVSEALSIPYKKPDMEQLLSIMVDPQVISVRLVETPVALSNEGQNLSGCKLGIELKLREKVNYVADERTQSVYVAHFENILKSVFVVVPCEIDGKLTRDLLRQRKVSVTPYIEDIYGEMRDERTIFKHLTVLVDVKFINC